MSHWGPLRGNGHRYLTSRSSTKQWSLISLRLHQDPLQGNGYWFPSIYIKTLCEGMVIDFLCQIEALYEAIVIDLFTLRPSTRQWSLISYVTSRPFARQWSLISLHQDPLWGNGHWFLMSYWGPLRGNGHRSLYIKTLYEAMVTDFFVILRPSTKQWSLIYFLLIYSLSSGLV